MLLQQHNEKETPQVKSIRNDVFMKAIKNKRESVMTQTGAIYGLGLMDACGRNAIISLCSEGTHKRMTAILGMAVFWQYWYWYPLIPFITLCFEPTMVMALNHDLVMPKVVFRSNAPSSLYAYPEPLKEEETQEKKTIEKAVLSITAKQKARELKREKTRRQLSEEGDNVNDVEMTNKDTKTTSTTEPAKESEGETTLPTTDADANKDKEKEKEKRKTF